jgi:ATP:corrinoid adenosyltransferase
MIPPTIHSAVRSGAERRLFHEIQKSPGTEGWFCLHSLGLARHGSKRRAEIDFLLITPDGIFILEVKGGRIRREGAVWVFTDRWGSEHRKSESPFDQAATCMFAIDRHLREHFVDRPRLARVMLGYGVVMPDVEFKALGVDADARQVYDARSRAQPFAQHVRRLTDFTRSVQSTPRNGLTKAETEELVDHFRGDFDLVPTFAIRAADVNDGLRSLTQNQYECLARAQDRPRLIIEGGAGTGKSILALELARREARAGRRVLLLCFNVLLAAKLKAAIDEPTLGDRVTVKHLHGYTRDAIDRAGLNDEFEEARAAADNEDEVYRHLHPYYAELALAQGTGDQFDVLIMDEAQDVLTDDVLSLMDASLQSGIDGGRWRIFLDANEQAAVYGALDRNALARLERLGVTQALTMNCRNTRQIEHATRALARPLSTAHAWQTGDSVELRWYRDDPALARELQRLLHELTHHGIARGRVTLLFPRAPHVDVRRVLERESICELSPSVVALGREGSGETFWTTVSSFKGLENDVIVLAGVEKLEPEWWRAIAYVGMSRARVRLYVLISDSLRDLVDERFAEMLRQALREEDVG